MSDIGIQGKDDKEPAIWLTDVDQIPTASVGSLRKSLITLDGRGETLKRLALDELWWRAYRQGREDALNVKAQGQ